MACSVKRRKLISSLGLGAGAGAGAMLSSCGGDEAGAGMSTKRVQWTLASSYPKSLDTIFGFAEQMANRVKEITGGRFTIDVYQAGEIMPGGEVFNAVQEKTVEIGHSAAYYYRSKHPAFAFETAVPFGLRARQQQAWLTYGGGLDLMNELLDDFNIRTLPGGNTGQQMGGWFRDEINSLEDLKGLKMRIPGMGGEIMSRLGATVQTIQSNEIYPALERGAIDAVEWVGPYDDQKLGFWQVAKHYYYPGWWEPGANLSIYVNQTAWADLPPSYQAVLEAACAESAAGMIASYDAKNPIALQELIAKGVKVHAFGDDIMQAAKRETELLHAELSEENAGYKKVYEQWKAFKDASDAWYGTAEQTFAEFDLRN
ncbi:MAG: TRAP-type mannitol/chloroaromatic compound transport system substrate-binding protein [Verrucomicrobiales bacterium]|jgi:TRAP-type mannitol/chloroaromatic compound transport system substrate-binding protein